MSKITELTSKAIAVEEHGEILESSIVPMTSAGTHSGTGLRIRIKTSHAIRYKSLPPGSWSILGRPEEITEEQWKGIVEWFSDYEVYSNSGYRNYSHPQAEATVKTATESGFSLLKSKGLNPSEVIILIKQ